MKSTIPDEAARSVVNKTREAASDAADAARTGAKRQVEGAKASLAGEVDSIATALRDAAGELTEGTPQARATAQAARTLDGFAGSIRDAEPAVLASDTADFARRNPVAFLGSAAVLGFAAARFAKASADGQPTTPRPEAPTAVRSAAPVATADLPR